MLTLKEARKIQKERESKVVARFAVYTAISESAVWALIYFADLLAINNVFYLLPIATLLLAFKFSGMPTFFEPKEFRGTITDIHVYATRDRVVKGAGWGNGSNVGMLYNVANIGVTNEKGRIMTRAYRNEHEICDLREGGEIIIMRFVPESPIIIRPTKSEEHHHAHT